MRNSTLFDQDKRPERCPQHTVEMPFSSSKATNKSYRVHVQKTRENCRFIHKIRYVRYIHDQDQSRLEFHV